MSAPDLTYPRRVLQDEAKEIERQLESITHPIFADQSRARMSACALAARILQLYETFEAEELGEQIAKAGEVS